MSGSIIVEYMIHFPDGVCMHQFKQDCQSFCDVITKDYIWQKDSFTLQNYIDVGGMFYRPLTSATDALTHTHMCNGTMLVFIITFLSLSRVRISRPQSAICESHFFINPLYHLFHGCNKRTIITCNYTRLLLSL